MKIKMKIQTKTIILKRGLFLEAFFFEICRRDDGVSLLLENTMVNSVSDPHTDPYGFGILDPDPF